ncbi:MAG: LuxR C-terminal-related transcriptional regulator [Capsulimonadaceae bacterium]|nr:LuxR C-terminal-related transcriptional regulator [Capsulimonadaceae bacterium]
MATQCPYRTCENIDELLSIDSDLFALKHGDMAAMGSLLQRAAEKFMRVDSCYVCLWDEERRILNYSYNYDSDSKRRIGAPCLEPIGDGPAAHVVRTRSSYVLPASSQLRRVPSISADDAGQACGSAIHVPIIANRQSGIAELFGVFSVQSYAPNVYDPHHYRLVEWLGRKAGQCLVRAAAAQDDALREISRLHDELCAREITLVTAFVNLFREMDNAIHLLQASPTVSDPGLKAQIGELERISRKVQARATCLHISTPSRPGHSDDLFAQLTAREKELLPYLASGMAYKEIASIAHISVSTVKYHLGHILVNLGIESRAQIALRLAEARTRRASFSSDD